MIGRVSHILVTCSAVTAAACLAYCADRTAGDEQQGDRRSTGDRCACRFGLSRLTDAIALQRPLAIGLCGALPSNAEKERRAAVPRADDRRDGE